MIISEAHARLYNTFLGCLRRLCIYGVDIDRAESDLMYCDYPPYWVRNMHRLFGHERGGLFLYEEYASVADSYVERCLGHKVSPKKFLKYPKICVLYARQILKDRFKLAEDGIAGDSAAAYLYSKYVIGGMLPDRMHSRLVLSSFAARDENSARYLRDFSGF